MSGKNFKKPNSPINFSYFPLILPIVSYHVKFQGSSVKIVTWAPVPRFSYLYLANNLPFVGFPLKTDKLTETIVSTEAFVPLIEC